MRDNGKQREAMEDNGIQRKTARDDRGWRGPPEVKRDKER
jgi:hypothetical protein